MYKCSTTLTLPMQYRATENKINTFQSDDPLHVHSKTVAWPDRLQTFPIVAV